jgi:hypothetical protein
MAIFGPDSRCQTPRQSLPTALSSHRSRTSISDPSSAPGAPRLAATLQPPPGSRWRPVPSPGRASCLRDARPPPPQRAGRRRSHHPNKGPADRVPPGFARLDGFSTHAPPLDPRRFRHFRQHRPVLPRRTPVQQDLQHPAAQLLLRPHRLVCGKGNLAVFALPLRRNCGRLTRNFLSFRQTVPSSRPCQPITPPFFPA